MPSRLPALYRIFTGQRRRLRRVVKSYRDPHASVLFFPPDLPPGPGSGDQVLDLLQPR